MKNNASTTAASSACALPRTLSLIVCAALAVALSVLPPATARAGEMAALVTLDALPAKPLPHKLRRALNGTVPGRTAARVAAGRAPGRASARERGYAARAERARNAALTQIRKNGRAAAAQMERVARLIELLGGRIHTINAPPGNQLAVSIDRALWPRIAALPGVAAVEPYTPPIAMNTWAGGSQIWLDNNRTGQVPNAENRNSAPGAGPDVVVYDQGVAVNHLAFRKRTAGDCSSCPGSGPSRVIHPASRTDFIGSEHGSLIAATIASTDLSSVGTTGMAYGIDQLQDVGGTMNPVRWIMGGTYNGTPGVDDLAEVGNFSAGEYHDTLPYSASGGYPIFDALSEQYGMQWVVSSGNCGVNEPSYTGCSDGPHRVATPASGFNDLAVGGFTAGSPDPATWKVWKNSSGGPTWDGRKKPDLVSSPNGGASAPNPYDADNNGKLDDYEGMGLLPGTSYAAPMVTAGVALLSSVGVAAPIAQRALLINTAQPIQGQTYWTPTSGWGALDLTRAFNERANYAVGEVTGAGANSARFYRITGAAAGDRTTLVWNRRLSTFTGASNPTYRALTNLDLFQLNSAGSATTGTGGVDAADSVDSNTTPSGTQPGTNAPTDNPMPGSGADAEDNVEQVRSTAAGDQLIKVKAMSAINSRSSESFALASARPITAIQTPIPAVSMTLSKSTLGVGQETTLTVTAVNPSNTLPLGTSSLTLSLPAGVTLTSGSATTALGTIAAGESASANLTIKGITGGVKNLTATASGTTYGEPFAGSASRNVTFDNTPPTVGLNAPGQYSTDPAPVVSWSASDDLSDVETFDVDQQLGDGAWTALVAGQFRTSATLTATEGQTVSVRVRARDSIGNVSGYSTATTTIDAVAPAITLGAVTKPSRGLISIPVSVTNAGAPVTAKRYDFSRFASGALWPLVTNSVSFSNTTRDVVSVTLRVEAEDAIGRRVAERRVFNVESKWIAPGLELTRLRAVRGGIIVEGRVDRGYHGRLRAIARRRGWRGTRQVESSTAARNGRFSVRLRAKAGRYRVTVIAPVDAGRYLDATVQGQGRAK
jgi:hypothetical protein